MRDRIIIMILFLTIALQLNCLVAEVARLPLGRDKLAGSLATPATFGLQ
jgi:hypothetical protein